MDNYSEMSDFEINKRVAKLRNKNYNSISRFRNSQSVCVDYNFSLKVVNYCNNPSDAWPIIVSNGIDIRFENVNENEWFCGASCKDDQDSYEPWFSDPNPLRAAMIVYLMMSEEGCTHNG